MPLPADLPLWVYGYAAAFALVHGAVLYYLYRATAATRSTDSSTETDAGAEDRTVVCENCGAENEFGYRYCRNCVRELSETGGAADAERRPATRGIL